MLDDATSVARNKGDLWRRGARELAAAIAEGQVAASAVVDAHLERIREVNPRVNAVVRVLEESALQAAAMADAAVERGDDLGPLHGVPVTIKDTIDVSGDATTQGVPRLAQTVAPADAPAVARLRAAGAIPIARTNLPDLALGWSTDSTLYGTTVNPWDPGRTPGGSSGGEAVAQATGMSPLGLGTDAGGSVRVPAAWCGTTALKPTHGRVARGSHLEPRDRWLAVQLMMVIGPMARRVADLRLALTVLSGPAPQDAWAVPVDLPDGQTRTLRIGVAPDVPSPVTDALADAGHELVEAAPPVEEAAELWAQLFLAELAAVRPLLTPLLGEERRPIDDLVEAVQPHQDLASHVFAYTRRHGIQRAWWAYFDAHDLYLSTVPPPFEVNADTAGPARMQEINHSVRGFTAMNLLGLPAAVVPITSGDPPRAVQIAGGAFREDQILDAAEIVEHAVGTMTPLDPQP